MSEPSFLPVNRSPWLERPYEFVSPAEADATYLVIAWFAITESASLGIFPLLAALETARKHDPASFGHFFETGFQHFTDEQHHANLWCRALLDFVEQYPQVVQRVQLPTQYLQIMLRSIGKPHDVLSFSVDCLAFEIVMQALYDVLQPRLDYPPLAPIWQVISSDERTHTDYGRQSLGRMTGPLTDWQRWRVAVRYWRNTLGVLITIKPMLEAVERHRPFLPGEFRRRLADYSRDSGVLGSRRLLPALIRWRA